MNNSELEKILVDSLADFKLDQQEKFHLKELSESLPDDQLNYLRNKSFDLCRGHLQSVGNEAFRALNWLERVIKAIQPVTPNTRLESSAHFSPGKDCRHKITSSIKQAKKQIDICVFTISDNIITRSIEEAFDRGVKVTIISDNDKSNDRGSDIEALSNRGVNVLLDDTSYHMHHKFAIFDKRILLNGSFNWTRSASDYNEENILITSEPKLVAAYSKKFEELKAQFSG